MEAHSNKTELNDRTLWFDGDSTVGQEEIARLIALGLPTDQMFVDQLTNDIRQFNSNVPKEQRITVKQTTRDHSLQWNIPEPYANLDIENHTLDRILEHIQELGFDAHTAEKYPKWVIERTLQCSKELALYQDHNLYDVLRALIYIINTLRAKNVVWGVGRGSSVSSYVLYLIGVHDVDSVKYELDIHDFLPPKNNN